MSEANSKTGENKNNTPPVEAQAEIDPSQTYSLPSSPTILRAFQNEKLLGAQRQTVLRKLAQQYGNQRVQKLLHSSKPSPNHVNRITKSASLNANPILGGVVQRGLPPGELVTKLEEAIIKDDKPAFFKALSDENGDNAGSDVVQNTINGFIEKNKLTPVEGWKAACLLVFGKEENWQPLYKNFYQGMVNGIFKTPATASEIIPYDAQMLKEGVLLQTQFAAEGASPIEEYRALFNAYWDAEGFKDKPAEFDPTLSSKGPRNKRARAIFDGLYQYQEWLREFYAKDKDFREQVDQYMGPDATNATASPRIQQLRLLFKESKGPYTGINDPNYTQFREKVRGAAKLLLPAERVLIRQSQQWHRLIMEATRANDIEVNQQLERDLIYTINVPEPNQALAQVPVHMPDVESAKKYVQEKIKEVEIGYSDQNRRAKWSPKEKVKFYGGQQLLQAAVTLPKESDFGGVSFMVQAILYKDGKEYAKGREELLWVGRQDRLRLGSFTLIDEEKNPVEAVFVVDFYLQNSNEKKEPFHTLKERIPIEPANKALENPDLVLAQAKKDYEILHQEFLPKLENGSEQSKRTAHAIKSGVLKLEPMLMRPDTAEYVHKKGEDPKHKTAILLGHTTFDEAHTYIWHPGPDAWSRVPGFDNYVFITVTLSLENPQIRPTTESILNNIVHESVHALDNYRPLQKVSAPLEDYKSEFRAYWHDGSFDKYSTAFDPSMDSRGPKSQKARAIFENVYYGAAYQHIRKEYDEVKAFRNTVNSILVPDGINLVVSPHLEELRKVIQQIGSDKPELGAAKEQVAKLYQKCTPEEIQQISGNRAWRDIVEELPEVYQEVLKQVLNIPI